MKKSPFYIAVLCILCTALLLSACSLRKTAEKIPASSSSSSTAQSQTQQNTGTSAPATSTPEPSPTPTPEPSPTPTPEPTPTPTPEPTPEPAPGSPVVTKSPTDETVTEGGSCYFVARYRDATWAVWHFVSPDGSRDLTYEEAQDEFSSMEIIDGMYSTMLLKNIPLAASGWSVYCRYSNRAGFVDTNRALLTVTAK